MLARYIRDVEVASSILVSTQRRSSTRQRRRSKVETPFPSTRMILSSDARGLIREMSAEVRMP